MAKITMAEYAAIYAQVMALPRRERDAVARAAKVLVTTEAQA